MTTKKPVINMGGTKNGATAPRIPAQTPATPPASTDPTDAPTPAAPDTDKDTVKDSDTDLDLDTDPDTSLVGSLSLHLLSEHAITGSLHLDEGALTAAHQRAHRDSKQIHAITDIRFRPVRALAAAMLSCHTSVSSPAPM
jgi:hypothetical protein